MPSITPCQRTISDRFPVVSFVVNLPPDRLFEIACATQPGLLRTDQRQQRNANNFFTSRSGGLMRAPAGHATYLLPPEQLRRFAGQQRLYYALGSYRDPRGEGAHFTVDCNQVDQAPFIRISPDFTGRALDRGRLARRPAEARYGAASAVLTWGGDKLPVAATAPAAAAVLGGNDTAPVDQYDDGYPRELWKGRDSGPAAWTADLAPGADPRDGADPSDPPDPAPAGEPGGFEDVPAFRGVAASARSATYGGKAVLEPEPSGSEDAPALQRGPASRVPQARYAGAVVRDTEPQGFEDAVGLAARAHASRGSKPVGASYAGRAAPRPVGDWTQGEPAGFEDGRAFLGAAATRRARYGAGLSADIGSSEAPGELPMADGAGSFRPPLVDDQYDDTEEDEEGELAGGEAQTYTLDADLAGVPLTVADKYRIILPAAKLLAGPEPYSAINADAEYADPTHHAYQRIHYGLHWGLAQFNQRSGALGRVLLACQRRDADRLREIFGPATPELLQVTNAATAEERVAPVGGSFLWQDPWLERFRRAGTVTAFQAAQNEVAIEDYLDRNLAFAAQLGFNTDRSLALLFERCVNMGNAGGRRWVVDAVSPLVTEAERAAAVHALGFPDLRSFQQQVPGLHATGRWGSKTHAALLGALRTHPEALTISIPLLPEMLKRLEAAAAGRRFEALVIALCRTSELSDTPRLVS